jgi:hypothetical protein
MASFSSTNEKIRFTTISVHGNTIRLYEEDYQHLIEHPEMVGQEDAIKLALEKPTAVREGRFPDSCAFDRPSNTNPEGVRVLVRHEKEMFLGGGVDGHVTTAFPINSKQYPVNRVGPVIKTYPENEPKNEPKKNQK